MRPRMDIACLVDTPVCSDAEAYLIFMFGFCLHVPDAGWVVWGGGFGCGFGFSF